MDDVLQINYKSIVGWDKWYAMPSYLKQRVMENGWHSDVPVPPLIVIDCGGDVNGLWDQHW